MDIKSETCEVEQVDHVKIEMTQLANVTNDSWTHENKPLLDEDWRNIKKDLKLEDQLMLMQDNRILVDCQIVSKANLFQPKVCHKVCLARISPDLERHFQSSSILSVDCDDDTCQALIRYAYTNTVLSNTAEPLLNLYRLAKKISCDRLMEICLQKFRGCLKAETAMCNFDMLDIEEDYDFAQQCIEFIAAHANNILKNITPFVYKTGTGSLKCLSTIKVKMILSEENMNISSEVVLLTAVQLWAEYHVKQQGKQPSYSTIKAEVKTLLPKLRILSLDEAELTEFFHITRMLTEEEQRMIAAYHTGKDKSCLPHFICKNESRRSSIAYTTNQTLLLPHDSPSSQVHLLDFNTFLAGDCASLCIRPDKDIYVHGVKVNSQTQLPEQLIGANSMKPKSYTEDLEVTLFALEKGENAHFMAQRKFKETQSFDSVIDVKFHKAMRVRANQRVMLLLKFKNNHVLRRKELLVNTGISGGVLFYFDNTNCHFFVGHSYAFHGLIFSLLG